MYKKILLFLFVIFILSACQSNEKPVQTYIIAQKDGNYGLFDYDGNAVTDMKYDFIAHCGNYYLTEDNGVSSIIDPEGTTVFTTDQMRFDNDFIDSETCSAPTLAKDTLIPVGGPYNLGGYIDLSGNVVIDFKYTKAFEFVRGLARVQTPNKYYGYINRSGEFVIPAEYDEAENFNDDGFAIVKKLGFYGLIDTKGNTRIDFLYVTEPQYTGSPRLYSIYSSIDKKWGLYSARNKQIVDFSYVYPISFQNGNIALVNQGGDIKYINTSGDVIFDDSISTGTGFDSSGFARVKKDGLIGYINQKGSLVIDYRFEEARQFSEGLAAVKEDGVWKYINTDGSVAFETAASDLTDFSNGYAMFRKNMASGFYDKEGNVSLFPDFYYAMPFDAFGYSIVLDGGDNIYIPNDDLYGVIDTTGKLILPIEYDYIDMK